MDSKKKSFIQNTLRRGSYRWWTRWKAAKRAHIGRNQYFCESCGIIGDKKSVQLDHVLPVVDPVKGFTGFDDYANRMYPDTEYGYQTLCKPCHAEKTLKENGVRHENRKPGKNRTKKSKKT